MIKHIAALSVILVSATMVRAQSTPGPTIRCAEGTNCSHTYIDGRLVRTLMADAAALSACVQDTGKYFRVDLSITNRAPTAFDVVPATFSIEVVSPKPKTLRYLTTDQLERTASRHQVLANVLGGMAAGAQQTSVTTETSSSGDVNLSNSDGTYSSGTYHGTGTATTTVPNYQAQAQIRQQAAERSEALRSAMAGLERTSLKANTLPPSQTITSTVYFERGPKQGEILLRLLIGAQMYEIPFKK